jgi:hypothetical protein
MLGALTSPHSRRQRYNIAIAVHECYGNFFQQQMIFSRFFAGVKKYCVSLPRKVFDFQ